MVEIISLCGVVREDLSSLIPFEQRPEWRAEAAIWSQIEGRACAKVLGKDCLSALKYMKEAGISEAE